MREFFHGWRRKAGCVTLVMACVLAGLWIRSLQTADVFWFAIGDKQFVVLAVDGMVSCSSRPIVNTVQIFTVIHVDKRDPTINWDKLPFVHWSRSRVWSASYWPMAIPLTLLSAWLLLSKPRQSQKARADLPP